MTRRKPSVGDVIQLALPTGQFAYGRVLRDASVAFYSSRSDLPGHPPIGERHFDFAVGVYDTVLRDDDVPVVGQDPPADPEEEWPPPYSVQDIISGGMSIYHRGITRSATEAECQGLEPAAVWTKEQLIARLSEASVEN